MMLRTEKVRPRLGMLGGHEVMDEVQVAAMKDKKRSYDSLISFDKCNMLSFFLPP